MSVCEGARRASASVLRSTASAPPSRRRSQRPPGRPEPHAAGAPSLLSEASTSRAHRKVSSRHSSSSSHTRMSWGTLRRAEKSLRCSISRSCSGEWRAAGEGGGWWAGCGNDGWCVGGQAAQRERGRTTSAAAGMPEPAPGLGAARTPPAAAAAAAARAAANRSTLRCDAPRTGRYLAYSTPSSVKMPMCARSRPMPDSSSPISSS